MVLQLQVLVQFYSLQFFLLISSDLNTKKWFYNFGCLFIFFLVWGLLGSFIIQTFTIFCGSRFPETTPQINNCTGGYKSKSRLGKKYMTIVLQKFSVRAAVKGLNHKISNGFLLYCSSWRRKGWGINRLQLPTVKFTCFYQMTAITESLGIEHQSERH